MLFEKPVMVEPMEDLGLELIGSVHSLRGPAVEILRELRRFSPDYVCVELFRPLQPTKAFELELARGRYLDRFVCIDRSIDVTVSRYYSGTPPGVYFMEALARYLSLPFNAISIIAYNLSPGSYGKLTGGRFFTFGWSRQDLKAYIFERDEFMGGTIADLMRSGNLHGKIVVLVGRRHLPGIKCVLEAFRATNDIGSYYAGGRVYDVFSLYELNLPYTLSYEQSSHNFTVNRIIETLVRMVFLSGYVFALFALTAAVLLIAMAIMLTLIKG